MNGTFYQGDLSSVEVGEPSVRRTARVERLLTPAAKLFLLTSLAIVGWLICLLIFSAIF